jgi:hypothetical protein
MSRSQIQVPLVVFLAKYNPYGAVLSEQAFPATSFGIATDAAGNMIIHGILQTTPITFGGVTLSNISGSDEFIASLGQ